MNSERLLRPIETFFADRKFRLPRMWSNRKLIQIGHLFDGDVVNVSAWRDEDKEGRFYRDYFPNAKSYTITNYRTDYDGYQGLPGELFLDLGNSLPPDMKRRFDVVFNHTTLEHIYDFKTAFENLCLMTRDVLIVVVPHLQMMHTNYGDFWRFTPRAVKRMYEENGLHLIHLDFNDNSNASVYIFAVGCRNPKHWTTRIPYIYRERVKSQALDGWSPYIGYLAIQNWRYIVFKYLRYTYMYVKKSIAIIYRKFVPKS